MHPPCHLGRIQTYNLRKNTHDYSTLDRPALRAHSNLTYSDSFSFHFCIIAVYIAYISYNYNYASFLNSFSS